MADEVKPNDWGRVRQWYGLKGCPPVAEDKLCAIYYAGWEGVEGQTTGGEWNWQSDITAYRIPAEFDLIVPLAQEAVDVLEAIRPLTGRMAFVFPSHRYGQRSMSANAIGYLYNRVGWHGRHVPHGWRAAFSTIMNERAKAAGIAGDREVIDLMLGHIPSGLSGSEGAYNRALYMPRRREIANEWAGLLDLPPASTIMKGTGYG